MSVEVLDGASVVAAAAIALFFARFYQATGDRFFAYFAGAFAIFAVDRTLIALLAGDSELRPAVYFVRALGFATIIWAVLDKNREPPPHEAGEPAGLAARAPDR